MKYKSIFNDKFGKEPFNGEIVYHKYGDYFYRKRERYKEVMAGLAKTYCFGIEGHIVTDLVKRQVDRIVIETEYNIWEISVHDFVENCYTHFGIKEIEVCPINLFAKTRKRSMKIVEKPKEEKPRTNVTYKQSSLF